MGVPAATANGPPGNCLLKSRLPPDAAVEDTDIIEVGHIAGRVAEIDIAAIRHLVVDAVVGDGVEGDRHAPAALIVLVTSTPEVFGLPLKRPT